MRYCPVAVVMLEQLYALRDFALRSTEGFSQGKSLRWGGETHVFFTCAEREA